MSFKQFKQSYIAAAMWSSTDNHGSPLDDLGLEIAEDTLANIHTDCATFFGDQASVWIDAGMSDSQAGHDFWLTRNKHGAGFWDRGLGRIGENLTAAAHAFGEVALYVGDDHMVQS